MRAIPDLITHRKIASAAVLVLLVILFWFSVTLQDIFYDVVSLAEMYVEAHQTLGILVFMTLAAVSAMLAPFSSLPLIPVAIILWGGAWTIAFLVAGWLVGHTITYAFGYYAGYPVVKKFIAFEKIEQLSRKFSKKSEFLLVLLFRLAMPAEMAGYVLGTARYDFSKYFLATFIAEIPLAIITVYASEALIKREPMILAIVVVTGFIFIGTIFYLFKKQIGQEK